MSSLAFVTHPSVRIKGTENTYTPSQCLDERCPVKAPHMHCPFCVKTDAYQDPVILKAHYRVKHVDKGIEFAGLKILRCCDHCDIVGIIKGEKRFKGAHWHCYRCKNGFNRRDEAIKHYKTHFRNPQTTFQIQITQDLNSPPGIKPHEESNSTGQDTFSAIDGQVQEIIHPALTQTALGISEQNAITSDASLTNGKVQTVTVKKEPLMKEESHDDQQTIMIIQSDQLESAFASHIISSTGEVSVLSKNSVDPSLSWEIRYRMEEEEKNAYRSKAEEYKEQVELLQQRISDLESQLAQESELKLQDFLNHLNIGDAQKQILAQQISKFLEENQNQEVQENSPTLNQDSLHLISGVAMSQTLDAHTDEQDHLETNTTTSIDQHMDSGNVVTQLDRIPKSYQVISATADGHVLLNPSTRESNVEVNELQENTHMDDDVSHPTTFTSASEPQETIYTHMAASSQANDIMVRSVLSAVTTNGVNSSLINGVSSISQTETGVVRISNTDEGLLQVVAAADGLASLGTDVAVVAADMHQDGSNTFIMEVGNGERIFVQNAVTETPVQTLAGVDEASVEPDSKRARVS